MLESILNPIYLYSQIIFALVQLKVISAHVLLAKASHMTMPHFKVPSFHIHGMGRELEHKDTTQVIVKILFNKCKATSTTPGI